MHNNHAVANPDSVSETRQRCTNGQSFPETRQRRVSTGLRPRSLGAIINQFKGAATKRIRTTTVPDFSWQSRFYDHVIRSEKSLEKIREYILNNPMQWEMDTENPDNVL